MITRRTFTQSLAAVGLTASLASGQSQTPPSEKIRLGIIGVGNRGDQVLSAFLAHKDCQIVAIADLYQPYLDFAAKKVGTNPDLYKDYRKLLDRKDIDAVIVASPDHWHAMHMIQACHAGKDVYTEKPLSLTINEGRAMVNVARKYNRVVQVGLQRRSCPVVREMMEFLRSGGIGKITTARAFHIQNEWPHGIGRPADTNPPANFDWESWVGPAPMKPYNRNRTLYRFRWFYDYSGGQITNMGTHYLDMIQWALGADAPQSVTAMGGKFADFDDREIPDTLEAMWTYKTTVPFDVVAKATTPLETPAASGPAESSSNVLVTFSQYNSSNSAAAVKPVELEFRGTKGTLYFRNNSYEVVPDEIPQREFPVYSPLNRATGNWRAGKPMIEAKQTGRSPDPTIAHARNFLDCIRSRSRCNCDIETGHRSTTATLMANIALKSQSMLHWDPATETFINNDAADKMLRYEYRKPYEFPQS